MDACESELLELLPGQIAKSRHNFGGETLDTRLDRPVERTHEGGSIQPVLPSNPGSLSRTNARTLPEHDKNPEERSSRESSVFAEYIRLRERTTARATTQHRAPDMPRIDTLENYVRDKISEHTHFGLRVGFLNLFESVFPRILFLKAASAVFTRENERFEPSYEFFRSQSYYSEFCIFFENQGVSIRAYNDDQISSVLDNYRGHLDYLSLLARAHLVLEKESTSLYSFVALEKLADKMPNAECRANFDEKFAVNCLYEVILIVQKNLHSQNTCSFIYEEEIFGHFIPVINLLFFCGKTEKAETFYLNVFQYLIPQLKSFFNYSRKILGMLESIEFFLNGNRDTIFIDPGFQRVYDQTKAKMEQSFWNRNYQFELLNGTRRQLLLSPQNDTDDFFQK